MNINRCPTCGLTPMLLQVEGDQTLWRVDCSLGYCWQGPVRETEAAAIDAWNKIFISGQKQQPTLL